MFGVDPSKMGERMPSGGSGALLQRRVRVEVVVDRGQVVRDIRRILARFIYLFGVADPREVPLDIVKNRMTIETICKDVPCLKFRISAWRLQYRITLAGNLGWSKLEVA